MEVIVKPTKHKVNPRDPAHTDPTYPAAVEKGRKNFSKMKFENEAQKKDYLKAVESNPGNVVGLPNFFPPLSTGTFNGFAGIDIEKKDMLPCGKRWMHASYDDKGNATYKCTGCNCDGFKEEDLTVDKPVESV